jgi:hypothetical protein
MLLYELITLKSPYYDIVDNDEIAKCIKDGIPPHLPPQVSKEQSLAFFVKVLLLYSAV